jgi:MFS family permease
MLLLAGHARVWELAVLAAARGIGTGFYLPASEGLLPHTVPADQRAPANALDRIGRNSGQIGGAALGGVLVGLAGPGWGLAADAVSFAVAGALRAGMRFPAVPPVPRTGLAHELREGWRDFISRRWLWVIVAQFAFVVAILTGTQSVLGPLVADAHLGGARSWGLIPPAMLSRLSSYDALGSFALAPVGTAVAGPLAATFGTSAVLTAGAVLIVLLTAAVLLVPEVRNMQRQAVSPAGRP